MASSSSSAPPPKRTRLLAELQHRGKCTKSGLANILACLQEQGLLANEAGAGHERTLRGRIQRDVESAAQRRTPYGKLIKKMHVGAGIDIEYVDPLAYLYVLANESDGFYNLLVTGRDAVLPFKLVIYIDEVCPGNPLRPEKSRTTQAIYWTFADLPANILVQSGMWLLFSIVRSSIVSEIPGKVSGLMRKVLRAFLPETGPSLSKGILVSCSSNNSSRVVRANFSGFIADEKALKEILGIKGASGPKPCPPCSNVVRFLDAAARRGTSLVGLDCADPSLFRYHNKESFYSMVDKLRAMRAVGCTKTALEKMEQMLGLNYDEANVVYDDYLRTIVDPIAHTIRDWMHTMVSQGVAGTHIALFLHVLSCNGITLDKIASYAARFHLPKGRGKVDLTWFAAHRVSDDHLRSFASEVLNMCPIIQAFLDDMVRPMGLLLEHVRCFTLLHTILQVFCLGPTRSVRHIDLVRESVIEHNRLFARLYPSGVKPKFHQMFHIAENMSTLGVLLSCFPMERKHRSVKSAALHVFRNFEHTVLSDLVNEQLTIMADQSLYEAMLLVTPRIIHSGKDGELLRSTVAHFPCGDVHAGDFVLLASGAVAYVLFFWSSLPSNIVMQVEPCHRVSDTLWSRAGALPSFVDVDQLVAPLVWAEQRPNVVRVCLPVVT